MLRFWFARYGERVLNSKGDSTTVATSSGKVTAAVYGEEGVNLQIWGANQSTVSEGHRLCPAVCMRFCVYVSSVQKKGGRRLVRFGICAEAVNA